jgi:thioredoxin
MGPINATDSNFEEEVLNTDLPVLVDVWAPWCGPCKMVGPAVKRLAEKTPERFKLVMANMEEFEKTAERFNIKTTPTMLLFSGGNEVARRSGALMETQIAKWLDEHL